MTDKPDTIKAITTPEHYQCLHCDALIETATLNVAAQDMVVPICDCGRCCWVPVNPSKGVAMPAADAGVLGVNPLDLDKLQPGNRMALPNGALAAVVVRTTDVALAMQMCVERSGFIVFTDQDAAAGRMTVVELEQAAPAGSHADAQAMADRRAAKQGKAEAAERERQRRVERTKAVARAKAMQDAMEDAAGSFEEVDNTSREVGATEAAVVVAIKNPPCTGCAGAMDCDDCEACDGLGYTETATLTVLTADPGPDGKTTTATRAAVAAAQYLAAAIAGGA